DGLLGVLQCPREVVPSGGERAKPGQRAVVVRWGDAERAIECALRLGIEARIAADARLLDIRGAEHRPRPGVSRLGSQVALESARLWGDGASRRSGERHRSRATTPG